MRFYTGRGRNFVVGEFGGWELADRAAWMVPDGTSTPILVRVERKASAVLIRAQDLTPDTRAKLIEVEPYAPCPRCEGDGCTTYLTEWHSYRDETCGKCDGTGKVRVQ